MHLITRKEAQIILGIKTQSQFNYLKLKHRLNHKEVKIVNGKIYNLYSIEDINALKAELKIEVKKWI